MSKSEILSELAKLSPADRDEIRTKLDELEGDRWLDQGELSEEDHRILEARLEDYRRNPDEGSSWREVEA